MDSGILDLLGGFGEGTLSDEEGMEFLRRLIGNAPIGEAPSGAQLATEAKDTIAEDSARVMRMMDESGVLPLLLLAEGGPVLGQALRAPGALLQFIKSRQAQKAMNEFVDIAARREAEKATMRNVNQKMSKELRARPSDHPRIAEELRKSGYSGPPEPGRTVHFKENLKLSDFDEAAPGNFPMDAYESRAFGPGAYDDYWAKTPRGGEGFTVNRRRIDELKDSIRKEGFKQDANVGLQTWHERAMQTEGHHRIRALQELVEEGAISPDDFQILTRIDYPRTYTRMGQVDRPGAFIPRSLGPVPTREAAQVPNLQAATRGAIEAEMKPTTLGLAADALVDARAFGKRTLQQIKNDPEVKMLLDDIRQDPLEAAQVAATFGSGAGVGSFAVPYFLSSFLTDKYAGAKEQSDIRKRIAELERMIAEEEKKEVASSKSKKRPE